MMHRVLSPAREEIGVRSLAIFIDTAGHATQTVAAVGIPITLVIDSGEARARAAQWDGPEAMRTIEGYLSKEKR